MADTDYYTARVQATSADDEARAAARNRSARGNLAAMVCNQYGIDPTRDDNHWHRVGAAAQVFAELADMLGLRRRSDA